MQPGDLEVLAGALRPGQLGSSTRREAHRRRDRQVTATHPRRAAERNHCAGLHPSGWAFRPALENEELPRGLKLLVAMVDKELGSHLHQRRETPQQSPRWGDIAP